MHARLLIVLTAFALLVPATAQADVFLPSDPGCDGREPTEADARAAVLRFAIAARRDYTLRADPAFVRAVERSPTARARARRRGLPFALTPAEARYFDVLRPRVQNASGRLAGFERRHRRILGGISIEDDFRDGPYLKVRLTVARPARYLPQLRRLARVRVRVARVAFSERQLERVQDRVEGLFDTPPAGVVVGSVSQSISDNRVIVTVATRRTDVQRELRRRFGGAVRVDVAAADPFVVVCTALRHVEEGGDDRDLRLHWGGSGSIELERAVVEETPDTVRVGVLERTPTVGGITADLQSKSTVVRLAAPLGARRVVDAETGRPLAVRRP